jgi:hypothetical protein
LLKERTESRYRHNFSYCEKAWLEHTAR